MAVVGEGRRGANRTRPGKKPPEPAGDLLSAKVQVAFRLGSRDALVGRFESPSRIAKCDSAKNKRRADTYAHRAPFPMGLFVFDLCVGRSFCGCFGPGGSFCRFYRAPLGVSLFPPGPSGGLLCRRWMARFRHIAKNIARR